jgi:hypothetical protein
MIISQKELAQKWGISRARVCTMVKNGMPLISEASAHQWRLANQKRVSRTQPILASSENIEIADSGSLKSENSLGRLIRAKRAELVAYSLVARASRDGNPVAMRAAISGWGEAKKRASEAEMEHARYEETTRQTIRMDEVREFITTWFGAIRNLMDAMPSSLSARANPSDPECAKVAIQEGVDQIFVTIQKAEGEFK